MRRWALLLVLAATLLAAWLSPEPAPETAPRTGQRPASAPRAPQQAPAIASQRVGPLAVDLSRRTVPVGRVASDPFMARTWFAGTPASVPQPIEAKASAAPPPTVPVLPYTFVGRVVDGGTTSYLLSRGERLLVLHESEEFDKVYRLERVEGSRLVVRYLPMNAEQSITMGGGSNDR